MVKIGVPKREQIQKAAERLFREKGFHATSVRDIAEAVGIQGGSLYAHVQSKDDLLWDIVNHSADRFFETVEPIVRSDRTLVQKLREAMIAHVGVITADLDAAAVFSTEWRHLPPGRREAFADRRKQYEQLFREMIHEGVRAGILNASDEAFAALFVLSALNWVYQWYKPDGRLTPEELGRVMADYVFDGLRRRAN